jgi:hypothetical protein
MKKLATEIEMLQEKGIYDIHWHWSVQSISSLIMKQHPTEDFYPVPSKSRLHEINWEQKNVKKLTLTWLLWFNSMNWKVFLFYSFQHITKFTQNLTLFDSGKHFITREIQL